MAAVASSVYTLGKLPEGAARAQVPGLWTKRFYVRIPLQRASLPSRIRAGGLPTAVCEHEPFVVSRRLQLLPGTCEATGSERAR